MSSHDIILGGIPGNIHSQFKITVNLIVYRKLNILGPQAYNVHLVLYILLIA